jgi:hypothetical protein
MMINVNKSTFEWLLDRSDSELNNGHVKNLVIDRAGTFKKSWENIILTLEREETTSKGGEESKHYNLHASLGEDQYTLMRSKQSLAAIIYTFAKRGLDEYIQYLTRKDILEFFDGQSFDFWQFFSTYLHADNNDIVHQLKRSMSHLDLYFIAPVIDTE